MKSRHTPIDVDTDDGWPCRVESAKGTYRVHDTLDVWVLQGRWWDQEERRVYFRLLTHRGTIEVYRSRNRWYLTRVAD